MTVIPYLKVTQKIYESGVKFLEFCWHQHFFIRNQQSLLYQEIQTQIAFWYIISISFKVFQVFKDCFNKDGYNLDMSTKIAALDLLKIKVFWIKSYDVIISAHDVINKNLSCHSNYIVDVVMWPKFGNSCTSMREVIITLILYGLDLKKHFFEVWSWFKFDNLGLALGMALKLYSGVIKELKLKVRKLRRLIFTFVEVTRGKLVGGGAFCPPLPPHLSWIGLILTLI